MLGSGIFLFLLKEQTKKKKKSPKIHNKIILIMLLEMTDLTFFMLGCLSRSNQFLSNFFLNITQTQIKFKCVHQNFELFCVKELREPCK